MVGDDQSGVFALAMAEQLRRNDQDALIPCRQLCLDGAFIKQGDAALGDIVAVGWIHTYGIDIKNGRVYFGCLRGIFKLC